MKFFLQVVVTILGCFIMQYFLPWWTMALAAFACGYGFRNQGSVSFAAGFVGAGVLWLAMAYYLDYTTQSILTEKINKVLPLNALAMTSLTGALVGGFAALTGALMRGKKLARY